MLREIPSGRGEGPSYMKVPYIESSFQVTSTHYCTVFGQRSIQDQEEGTKKHLFASVHLSICMY